MDDEVATLEGQYFEFSKFLDPKRDGITINLYRSDFWMRQAKLLDDRKLTMTDTGIVFFQFGRSEINYEEWLFFLEELCKLKDMDLEFVKETLTNCGVPGQSPVLIPHYRDYFLNYKPPVKGLAAG